MPKGNKTIKIAGLVLAQPSEIPLVLEAIRTAVQNTRLYLTAYPASGAVVEFRLSDAQAPPAHDGDPGHVVHFFDIAEWRYWLGLQLKFRTERGEARFQSASVVILRSALAAEEKRPLLRAEWEFREGDEHRRHAQPHWHVYAAEVEGGQGNGAMPAMKRFHWAMATGWHQQEEGESHYRLPSAEGIAGWVRRCVMYTREELRWVAAKM